MLVCSIPIRTFDINKDGRVFNVPATPMQLKIQQKKPIRSINYLKMIMQNRFKEPAKDRWADTTKSRTTSIQTHRQTLSQFNPEIAREGLAAANKLNKRRHQRTLSQNIQSKKKGSFLTDTSRAFPEGRVKKSADPKWHNYCAFVAETARSRGCHHYHEIKLNTHNQHRQKPKTAPKRYIRPINIDQQQDEQLYYQTIQYKSSRMTIKRPQGHKIRGRINSPDISPWAISLQNLEQHEA